MNRTSAARAFALSVVVSLALALCAAVIADELLGGDDGIPVPLFQVGDAFVLFAEHP